MAPTIEWYNQNRDFLKGIFTRNLQFVMPAPLPPVTNLEQTALNRALLQR